MKPGIDVSRPVRIAFVLTGLALGGAEMMLWKVLSRINRERFDPLVLALSADADALVERFEQSQVDCYFLGMRRPVDAFLGLVKLAAALRRLQPDIVQGWMYQGNVAATLARAIAMPRRPLLWAIRAGLTELSREKWHVAVPVRLSRMLSFAPHKIINNSFTSAAEHEQALGYPPRKRVIVPNGFDVDLFKPSYEARLALRQALHLPGSATLIGLVARYHWVKDHETFLRAAQAVSRRYPEAHYLLVGDDADTFNSQLGELVRKYDLGGRVHLLGRRSDMHNVTAALDIAVSSSLAEGFSNVIGEAMSCGVPCVATDVGDSARVLGDTGKVTPSQDAVGMASALCDLLAMAPVEREALGRRARERIVDHYSLDAIVKQYEELYSAVHHDFARVVQH